MGETLSADVGIRYGARGRVRPPGKPGVGLRTASMVVVFALGVFIPCGNGHAQGVPTAGVRGVVRADDGAHLDDVRVAVVHAATGYSAETRAHGGRFLLYGLEIGGPYTLTIQRIGFVTHVRDSIYLGIGALPYFEIVMQRVPVELQPVRTIVHDATLRGGEATHGGAETTISEALLERLPSLNRDFYDFVRLVPQISTRIGLPNAGFSGGGVGFRYNNFVINGVSERTLSGNVSAAFTGTKSVPLDAVQEYQVLIAPYDVRYGDFAGALVNTVTKAGTNQFRGSAFAYYRNDRYARSGVSPTSTSYDMVQYGFSAGGPIIRDRLHFFVAPELRRFTYPALGPYVGQSSGAERPLPVSAEDVSRFQTIMTNYGLNAGSAGFVANGSPLRGIFARLDLTLPHLNSRAVAWYNGGRGGEDSFSRAASDTFSLTSYAVKRVPTQSISAIQVHTQLPRAGGGHNELLVALNLASLSSLPPVREPIVRVAVPGSAGGLVTLNAGTNETAQGIGFRTNSVVVKDAVTLPFADNVLTLGAEVERFRIRRGGTAGSYGTWTFANLDAFERGLADRYQRRLDFGSAGVPLSGTQYAAYLGDRWHLMERLALTAGIRADLLTVEGGPPYNQAVDSIFSRRTDRLPRARIELSPRLGFVWNADSARRHQLRGGLGLFAARPPLAWVHTALSSYGVGTGDLRCGPLASDRGLPPDFVPDYRAAPAACAGGVELGAPTGDVDLLSRNLRMMRTLRGSLAYDHRLGRGLLLTNEVVVTRALSDFVFVNLNLKDSQSVDSHGRVLYGSFLPNGTATPGLRSRFSEVIELANTSLNRTYQVSTRIEKRFERGTAVMGAYTFSRARDVQTPLRVNARGTVAWASARPTSGRHDDLTPGVSGDDIPHRVVLAGTYAFPWWNARTSLSFYYVGESGRPFTYLATGARGLGDLNADGATGNDPVYVPRNVRDDREIRFGGSTEEVALQQAALAKFLDRTACLRRQQGHIMERNSCREPWSNTTAASLRQELPVWNRSLELQVDAFNVLNLLNSDWGHRRVAVPPLLQHVGQATDASGVAQPVFRFDPVTPRWIVVPTESGFQLQLSLRYRF
jgi:hypothetical protein